MPGSSEHKKDRETPRGGGVSDGVSDRADGPGTEGPSALPCAGATQDAAAPAPVEVFLLDYDRELAYLEHEGARRVKMRPMGFK